MLVATFRSSTAWQGREIIWDVDHFILVGHGAVPAAGVLDYDRRGQLVWADPSYRAWVAFVNGWEHGGKSTVWRAGVAPRPASRGRDFLRAPPGAARPGAPSARRGRVPPGSSWSGWWSPWRSSPRSSWSPSSRRCSGAPCSTLPRTRP